MSVLVDAGRRGSEPVETRKTAARPWEIDDELWARIEPLLPVVPRNPRRPGRKRLDSRKVLCGRLFMPYSGIRWEIRDDIHHAFVTLGCAVICWRRLRTALCRE
ncbi:transposase [Streptomyces sp. NPDC055140]